MVNNKKFAFSKSIIERAFLDNDLLEDGDLIRLYAYNLSHINCLIFEKHKLNYLINNSPDSLVYIYDIDNKRFIVQLYDIYKAEKIKNDKQ